MSQLRFVCPRCGGPLTGHGPDQLNCAADALAFERRDGVWCFLLPEREPHFALFMKEYAAIREQEQRGSNDRAYYRALPFQDLTGTRPGDWRIRAAGYTALLKHVILERESGGPMKILDLGAGSGWLSNRLAERGHTLVAVDLQTNDRDGLGAWRHYDTKFTPIQAEFDRLPLAPGQFDVVVFNAAFHYSEEYERTLAAALAAANPTGVVTILDSPVYNESASGQQMVQEREAFFERRYGTRSNALASGNFLTRRGLADLAVATRCKVQQFRPVHPLMWRLRPWWAQLRGGREPAEFMLVVFQKSA